MTFFFSLNTINIEFEYKVFNLKWSCLYGTDV